MGSLRAKSPEVRAIKSRLRLRSELVEVDRLLTNCAGRRGARNFSALKSMGYRGLYGKTMTEIRAYKANLQDLSLPKVLLDVMGTEELFLNLVRLQGTVDLIEELDAEGQKALEKAAFQKGAEVVSGGVNPHISGGAGFTAEPVRADPGRRRRTAYGWRGDCPHAPAPA